MKPFNISRRVGTALALAFWVSSGSTHAQQTSPANECGMNIRDWAPEQGSLHYTVTRVGKSMMDHDRAISVGDSLTLTSTSSPSAPLIEIKLQHFKIDKLNGPPRAFKTSQRLQFRFREDTGSYKDYDGRRLMRSGGFRVVSATCGEEGKVDHATLQLFDDYMAMGGESEEKLLQDTILIKRSTQLSMQ